MHELQLHDFYLQKQSLLAMGSIFCSSELKRSMYCATANVKMFITEARRNDAFGDLIVPRPSPSFPLLAEWLSGRGPGTFPHVSDVTDRANYVNEGIM